MMDWQQGLTVYVEVNLLLGLVWILWALSKKTMKSLQAESTQQRQLLIVRLLFLFLLISPVLVRVLPPLSWEALGARWESFGPLRQISFSPFLPTLDFLDPLRATPSLLAQSAEPDFPLSELINTIQQVKGQSWLILVFGIGLFIQVFRVLRDIVTLHRVIRNGFLWKKIGKL